MGLLRNRNGGDDHVRYRMQEKPISIGDDYWITVAIETLRHDAL